MVIAPQCRHWVPQASLCSYQRVTARGGGGSGQAVCPAPAGAADCLVGGGSGHGYKHGIMLGDYVANRVVGKDKNPELAETFKLKDRTF